MRDCLHLVVVSLETFVVKDSETGNQKVIFLSRPILCSNETCRVIFKNWAKSVGQTLPICGVSHCLALFMISSVLINHSEITLSSAVRDR